MGIGGTSRSMQVPLLIDFTVRLAMGLSALLLATSTKEVPSSFFRTHCLVILGLLVLGALASTSGVSIDSLAVFLGGLAFAAYLGSASWGLGLHRVAAPLTVLIAIGTSAWLIDQSQAESKTVWVTVAMTRLASSLLMGSTVSAMLLGHHYLTSPTMSIDPLKRYTRCMTWGLFGRAAVAIVGLALTYPLLLEIDRQPPLAAFGPSHSVLLLVRWGMGLAAPALATWMAWKTEQIRSTQSATGILYIATTLVFFGELTAMILARDGLLT